MARVVDPERRYIGRRADGVPLNFTVDRAVAEKLRTYAGGPGRKNLGKFVSTLLHDYELRQARVEERQRVNDQVMKALGQNDDEHPE